MGHPRVLWHLRKTVAQETNGAEPNHRATASVIAFGGAALTYLEDKNGFLGARISDPSTLVERNTLTRE